MTMLFGRPGRDEFANRMRERFLGVLQGEEILYDMEEFCLRIGGSNPRTVHLANVYMEFCAAPFWRRNKILTAWTETIAVMEEELPDSLEAARSRLLPQVRERFTWDLLKLVTQVEGKKEFMGPPTKIIAGDLSVEVVYDMPRSTRTVGQDSIEAWGTDFDTLLEIARQNLREASGPNFKRVAPGVYVSQWHDTFDAARMMTIDLFFDLEVQGHHVVFIPHRDELVVTGTLEETGLSFAAQYVTKSLQELRPITGRAYRLGGVEWFPFLPPPEHAAYNALKELALNSQAGCYSEQQNYLQKLCEKRGEDIFVANQVLIKDQTEMPQSLAIWTKGVDMLLPEAEFVFFVDLDREPQALGRAPWERVLEVLGPRMAPQGLFPERYRVKGFPTDEELAAIPLTTNEPLVQ